MKHIRIAGIGPPGQIFMVGLATFYAGGFTTMRASGRNTMIWILIDYENAKISGWLGKPREAPEGVKIRGVAARYLMVRRSITAEAVSALAGWKLLQWESTASQ